MKYVCSSIVSVVWIHWLWKRGSVHALTGTKKVLQNPIFNHISLERNSLENLLRASPHCLWQNHGFTHISFYATFCLRLTMPKPVMDRTVRTVGIYICFLNLPSYPGITSSNYLRIRPSSYPQIGRDSPWLGGSFGIGRRNMLPKRKMSGRR